MNQVETPPLLHRERPENKVARSPSSPKDPLPLSCHVVKPFQLRPHARLQLRTASRNRRHRRHHRRRRFPPTRKPSQRNQNELPHILLQRRHRPRRSTLIDSRLDSRCTRTVGLAKVLHNLLNAPFLRLSSQPSLGLLSTQPHQCCADLSIESFEVVMHLSTIADFGHHAIANHSTDCYLETSWFKAFNADFAFSPSGASFK